MITKTKIGLLVCLFTFLSAAATDDSTGLILKNNKVFKLHTIDNGQGLMSVARRYKSTIAEIQNVNPGLGKDLVKGRVILIPTNKTEAEFFGKATPFYTKMKGAYTRPDSAHGKVKESKAVSDNAGKTSFSHFYTPMKGETLYSVSQKFNTTVDFLKQLNRLPSDKIEVGKDILVPVNESLKEEPDQPAAIIVTKTDSLKTVSESLPPKGNETATVPGNQDYTILVENIPEYDVVKVTETGLGKVVNDKRMSKDKDWVIHHNAPENTILRITNPVNNKTVYAKVIHNFDRTTNDPLILYLNKNTADYLGVSLKDSFTINVSFAK